MTCLGILGLRLFKKEGTFSETDPRRRSPGWSGYGKAKFKF